jgi:2-dehydro-3-deoxyphosphogluconate aldolase/(4S)-4-hydroxy-2-oxoglutarate aldolase
MSSEQAAAGVVMAPDFAGRQEVAVAALGGWRLVPVIALDDAGKTEDLAAALGAGGLPCMEITLRTAAGLEAIRRAARVEGMTVGAGTVLSAGQAEQAVAAGASFIVAPGFSPRTVGWCLEHGVPVFPGVCTPTEIEMALEFGLSVLKFFPAEAFGGVSTLKALCGPYRMLRFIPTGGVSTANLADYLAVKQVVACGGSWMVAPKLLEDAAWEEVTRITREAVAMAAAGRDRGRPESC